MFALADINSFYASCEKVFRPDLRNEPVIVLSNNDGCVIARSPEAKALGIRMGQPRFQVRQMCQRQDYWPFFAIFNVRYWSLMLSAFRHFIITDWRGVFCQHSRFAFFL